MIDDGDALHLTGGIPLGGTVTIRGSKNAVPKLMVAALLTEEPVLIHNVAQIVDTVLVSELLEMLGCSTAKSAHVTAMTKRGVRTEEAAGLGEPLTHRCHGSAPPAVLEADAPVTRSCGSPVAAASASARSICTWRSFARSARSASAPTPASS